MNLVISAGHGSWNPKNGMYYSIAPGKQHTHSKGFFHDGPVFYEGVFNRQMAKLIEEYSPFKNIRMYNEYLDMPLKEKSAEVRRIARSGPTVVLDLHANAFNTKVRGFECFSYLGDDDSDVLNTFILSNMRKEFPSMKIRPGGPVDSNDDKDRNFHMLRETRVPNCYASLIEFLFFDNYYDAKNAMRPEFREKQAKAVILALIEFNRYMGW